MKAMTLFSRTSAYATDVSMKQFAKTVAQVLFAAACLALFAQIRIPLFFTPVPLTGHTFMAMLIGAFLGRKKGVAAACAYVAAGILGAPVFLNCNSGFHYFTGLTCGYLVGLIVQSFVVGALLETRKTFSKAHVLFALSLSVVLQLGLGMMWFAQFSGFEKAFELGVCPFVLGELFKVVVAASFIQLLYSKTQTAE